MKIFPRSGIAIQTGSETKGQQTADSKKESLCLREGKEGHSLERVSSGMSCIDADSSLRGFSEKDARK
jgi:hypothetical protein